MPKVKCLLLWWPCHLTRKMRGDKNCANSFCSSSLFNQLFVENEGKRVISVSNLVHCVRIKRPFLRKNFQVFFSGKTNLRRSYTTLSKKSNFCPNNQFWQKFTIFLGNQSCQRLKSANPQHFHEFFYPKFFWQFFSWNQSCQQLRNPKPQYVHEFSPKKSTILGKSKLNIWTKNENFEQCDTRFFTLFSYYFVCVLLIILISRCTLEKICCINLPFSTSFDLRKGSKINATNNRSSSRSINFTLRAPRERKLRPFFHNFLVTNDVETSVF